jgi:hypothetical protein
MPSPLTNVFLMVTLLLEALVSSSRPEGSGARMSIANASSPSKRLSGKMGTAMELGAFQFSRVMTSDPAV